jgi:hypothetical protein
MAQYVYKALTGIFVSAALCGGAVAHGISADGWDPIQTSPGVFLGGTGTTVSVNPAALPEGLSLAGITSLSFTTGTGPLNPANNPYEVLTLADQIGMDPLGTTADEWLWNGTGANTPQAVTLFATSLSGAPMLTNAPVFTIGVGYQDTSNNCADVGGAIASITVNGNTYTAKNPCALAAGPGDLKFVDGVLQAGYGVGWTESSGVAKAPEINVEFAGGAVTLLLGGLLVLRGRPRGTNARFA